MTRNGKIARLPERVRNELNRRIDDGELGVRLVDWLNGVTEVKKILQSDFSGRPISEQNLSEWKNGGYLDWQKRQERHELVRQLEADAADLGNVTDNEALNRHLSIILTADLAQTLRDVMETNKNPLVLAEYLGQLVGKFTRLRREESNAARVQLLRERWKRKLTKEEENRRACSALMPLQALLIQESYLQMFGQASDTSRRAASDLASELLFHGQTHPTGENLTESN